MWNQRLLGIFASTRNRTVAVFVRLRNSALRSSAWQDPPSTYFLQPSLGDIPCPKHSWQKHSSCVPLSYTFQGAERVGLTVEKEPGAQGVPAQYPHRGVLSHGTWPGEAEPGASIGGHQQHSKQQTRARIHPGGPVRSKKRWGQREDWSSSRGLRGPAPNQDWSQATSSIGPRSLQEAQS